MKKFLSIIGVSVLSLSLFAGCGSDSGSSDATTTEVSSSSSSSSASGSGALSDDEEAIKTAMLDYVSAAKAIYTNIDALSDDDKKELVDVSKEMAEYTLQSVQDPDPAEMAEKYNEFTSKFKALADSNNITVEPVAEDELQDALAEIQASSQKVQQSMAGIATDGAADSTTTAQ